MLCGVYSSTQNSCLLWLWVLPHGFHSLHCPRIWIYFLAPLYSHKTTRKLSLMSDICAFPVSTLCITRHAKIKTDIFKEKCLFMSTFIKKPRSTLFIENLVYIRYSVSINYSALIASCRISIAIHFTENMDLNSHSNRPHQIWLKKWCSFCNFDIAIQTRGLQDCLLKCSLNRQW